MNIKEQIMHDAIKKAIDTEEENLRLKEAIIILIFFVRIFSVRGAYFIMENKLLKAFWTCGDNYIIEFALVRARLNRMEKAVVLLSLDECMTQEQIAEQLDTSTRNVQKHWHNATQKLLKIPWLIAYAKELTI